jgi:hypothetical protein
MGDEVAQRDDAGEAAAVLDDELAPSRPRDPVEQLVERFAGVVRISGVSATKMSSTRAASQFSRSIDRMAAVST